MREKTYAPFVFKKRIYIRTKQGNTANILGVLLKYILT
jgi:hypothetical protein